MNACYSSSQVEELKKLTNISYIITNNNEISETLASNFAIEFYKEYKHERNIPRAFYNAFLEYRINYSDKKYQMQEIYPNNEYNELNASKQALPPFYQKIIDDKIRIIQTKQIPRDLMKKVENTIRAFDEDILLSNDTLKFRNELTNISNILSTLMVYSLEYVSNIDPILLRNQKRYVDELMKRLDEVKLLLTRKERVELMEKVNKEIIIQIFKKIYFNITIDSIQKITPLIPEEADYEIFGDMIGMMYAILKPLNLLREKINQSFVPYDKFYKDSVYRDYVMNICLDIIYHIDIDYNDFLEVIDNEILPGVDSINDYDAIEIGEYIGNIRSQLQVIQEKKSEVVPKKQSQVIQKQKEDAKRNIRLVECLENISRAEEKLVNLFRTIILKGLDYKIKNSPLKLATRLYEKIEAIDEEIKIERSYEEIDTLQEKLLENTSLEDPQILLPAITKLINKIGKEYEIYSTNKDYAHEDIYSCFKKMDKTLRDLIDFIDSDVVNNKYPYIFPEMSELRNYWKFRLNALQRKGARQYLIKMNYYFLKKLYGEVSKFKIDKDNENNPKLLNKIGIAQMYSGKYSEAIETFSKIDESTANTDALFNLGLAYQKLDFKDSNENIGQAIAMFEKVIELDEDHVDALASLGILYYKIGNYTCASKYIKKAIEISEHDDWRVLLAMGCILSDNEKDYKGAKRYFEMCEALNPSSILVNLNKSQNLILLESYDEGQKLLTSIRKEKIEVTGDKTTDDVIIEDRSTRIIMNILLICLRYLNKDGSNSENERLIKDLLRLLDLKDSKLVEWNFQNLEDVINDDKSITFEDKGFLTGILSIPGAKPKEDIDALKRKIQDYLVKNKLQSTNIEYIPDNNVEKLVKIETTLIDKSERDYSQWYHWKISLDLSELSNEESIEYVVYTFDPSFQNAREKVYAKDGGQNFPINVVGREESKFEIELKRKDGSIIKMVSRLSP